MKCVTIGIRGVKTCQKLCDVIYGRPLKTLTPSFSVSTLTLEKCSYHALFWQQLCSCSYFKAHFYDEIGFAFSRRSSSKFGEMGFLKFEVICRNFLDTITEDWLKSDNNDRTITLTSGLCVLVRYSWTGNMFDYKKRLILLSEI